MQPSSPRSREESAVSDLNRYCHPQWRPGEGVRRTEHALHVSGQCTVGSCDARCIVNVLPGMLSIADDHSLLLLSDTTSATHLIPLISPRCSSSRLCPLDDNPEAGPNPAETEFKP